MFNSYAVTFVCLLLLTELFGSTLISQQLKRKNGIEDSEVQSSEWGNNSPGMANISSSLYQTPISAKGGRVNSRSRATKGNRSTPQTPISNAGKKQILISLGSLASSFML